MIFLYAVVLGILLGYLLRGRIAQLPSLELRGLWLVLSALAVQLVIFPLLGPKPILPYGTAVLHAASYGLVLLWLVLNLRVRPLLVMGAGALLNALVVSANGGYMPASLSALTQTGANVAAAAVALGDTYGNIVGMTASTRLNFLGDWISLPHWLPFATVMSVGDALIMVGLVWLLAKGMTVRGQDT
jgi:hypothetical protein